jgi:phosphate ABC transporter phosphate-binding protein
MSQSQTASCNSLLRILLGFAALAIQMSGGGRVARAQSAETLGQVKKVYVEPLGADDAASKVRERIIEQLRKSGRVEVVAAAKNADALIKGNESIWVTGYYSTSPRAPSNARQPILQGFLSVEVVGRDNETLWSYLATPSKFRSASLTQDLADQVVTRLVGALEQKSEKLPLSPVTAHGGEISLRGAGATFSAPLYQKWFESFQERYPKTHISYRAVGSEAGIQLLADRKVDFAASDAPLTNERMSESKSSLLHFATVLGAVVPIYNLKGVDRNLNFTGEVLAGIYMGKIKKWNDPKIRESNRNAKLPDENIVVIHRSDGSGTTFVWTEFLAKVSPEWKTAVGTGTLAKWPVGAGAEGNEGVAAMAQQTANSIGYVELVYALRRQLSFGTVRNAAGEFVKADLASVNEAARSAAGAMRPDFRVSITNAPGKGAYPIATFTWWLLPADLGGADKKAAFLGLLQWMLTSGQKQCSALGYAPLPREVANQELQFLSTLK